MKAKRWAAFLLIPIFLPVGCGGRDFPLFKPLKPDVLSTSNGVQNDILADPEFPTVQAGLFIQGGAVYDPPGKEGLSAVAMQTIRLGGIEGMAGGSPDAVEKTLETVGASLELGSSAEFLTGSIALMKKDLASGLDLFFGLLRRPALDRSRFELVKIKAKEALAHEKEDPLALASRYYPALVYGPDSPWGRRATPESIDRITWEDVREFWRANIVPDRMLFAVSGDLSSEEWMQAVELRVDGWKEKGAPLPEIPPVVDPARGGVTFLPIPGLTQTTILVGHLGGKRDSPDKFPLLILNFILGGGGTLSSRLGETIRTSEGKAYGVWSEFGFGKDAGIFRAVAQTASENTEWVVRKIRLMIADLVTRPKFSEEEVDRAKQAILKSLVFDFETRFSQVREQARFRLWGYPGNYLEIFQKEIDAVSQKDLERVAKKYLHPDRFQILLVGDPNALKDAVNRLGDLAPDGKVQVKEAN